MKNWRLPALREPQGRLRHSKPAALVLLIALALGAAWFVSRPDPGRNSAAADLRDGRDSGDCGAPLQMPGKQDKPGTKPAIRPDAAGAPAAPETTKPVATEVALPIVDTPDYGPAICRGGAFVDFELYDPAGTRVPVQYYSVKLWRKVGSYWLREEALCDSNAHLVRCQGIGEQDIPPTGLEPGAYELELQSNSWGNFRHDFNVTRGEQRTEKLTTPNTRTAVSLRFMQQDGTPISHLPDVPSVKAVSAPLEAIGRDAAPTVELRRPPTEGGASGGGMYWRSSPSGDPKPREWPEPPLYTTDDGLMWAIVYAGAENTVTVKLNEELFGQAEYTLVDTFTSRASVDVPLNCCVDFEARLLAWGKPIEGFKPGYAEVLDKPVIAPPNPEFDPYTAPVPPEYTRLIIELAAPVPMQVQLSRDAKVVTTVCYRRDDAHFYDIYSAADWWFRMTDNKFYVGAWEKLDLANGQGLTLQRSIGERPFTIDLRNLSPTLREFAHTADFDIVAAVPPKPGPTESAKPVDDVSPDPNAEPNPDLEPHPYRPADPRLEIPAGHERASKFVMHRQRGTMEFASVAAGESVEKNISHGLSLRTHLRGAARWNRDRNSSASKDDEGRFYWQPKVLNGRWQSFDTGGQSLRALLDGNMLQPGFDNVLVARAVGPQTEGLPWVHGVILRHEDDEVAQQVRQIARGWKEYIAITPTDPVAYTEALDHADDDEALRALIGERAYDAFETREQRQWYARFSAWYDTSRKVHGDEQGYIAIENPALEPGGCYVLYLWSNSKDDLNPDARFVFMVDDNGVADLGAIHLPAYTD